MDEQIVGFRSVGNSSWKQGIPEHFRLWKYGIHSGSTRKKTGACEPHTKPMFPTQCVHTDTRCAAAKSVQQQGVALSFDGELRHLADQLSGLHLQAAGGGGNFLDQGRVLLGDLVHLHDRFTDL